MAQANVTVEQTRSPIGRPAEQRATLIGLKLNKIGRRASLEDTPAVRGMIAKVAHLVRVVEEGRSVVKLNDLSDNPGALKERMRVGRGIGSGKGKTGGRGVKGQKARSGVPSRASRAVRCRCIGACPSAGSGTRSRRTTTRSTSAASRRRSTPASSTDATVTIDVLVAAGICSKPRDGVKILGVGDLTTKLSFEVASASKSAVAAIEKAGGSITVLVPAKPSKGAGLGRGVKPPPARLTK